MNADDEVTNALRKNPIEFRDKRAVKVRNKAPAPIQITAEQLLREAKERELEIVPPPPKTNITDPEELSGYRLKRRKEYEDNIRKNRLNIANWIKYAKWEEAQSEFQRARSVFERSLDIDHRNVVLWLQYAEMEMRQRQINHARNVWDRAITILPRANQFWLKYTYMEEMIGNLAGARQVFERWMEWEPAEQAWQTYINFELRYKEIDRARQVWQRFLHCHHDMQNWLRYAKFEIRNGAISNARAVYERALEFFGEQHVQSRLLIAFAKFEESQKEHDRARVIYRYALDNLPKDDQAEVYKAFTQHEKRYGERQGIETAILSKRKAYYEELIAENELNYDAWFDYIRLMQTESDDIEATRDVFERAIAAVPPKAEKRLYRRYVYLWLNYALFEELDAADIDRCRQVYTACIELIPHKQFTFAKVWIMFAHFELRQKNLTQARKIMGVAIGKCAKEKLFRAYIDMELQLREFDRCRTLYEKCLEWAPENCMTWMKFAELETLLGDTDRARAIYELAIEQPALDMPEVLWKAYIDFEVGQDEYEHARNLFRRLLQRTRHVKVWLAYSQFELNTHAENCTARARQVLQKGNSALAESSNEERLLLLEHWLNFEKEHGEADTLALVEKEMPRRVKKRRPILAGDGTETGGWEEYYDYIFPSDQTSQASLKLLELAKKWKKDKAIIEEPTSTTATSAAAVSDTRMETSAADDDDDEQPTADGGEMQNADADTDLEDSSSSGSSSSSSSSSSSDDDVGKDGEHKKKTKKKTKTRDGEKTKAKKNE